MIPSDFIFFSQREVFQWSQFYRTDWFRTYTTATMNITTANEYIKIFLETLTIYIFNNSRKTNKKKNSYLSRYIFYIEYKIEWIKCEIYCMVCACILFIGIFDINYHKAVRKIQIIKSLDRRQKLKCSQHNTDNTIYRIYRYSKNVILWIQSKNVRLYRIHTKKKLQFEKYIMNMNE